MEPLVVEKVQLLTKKILKNERQKIYDEENKKIIESTEKIKNKKEDFQFVKEYYNLTSDPNIHAIPEFSDFIQNHKNIGIYK